MEKLILRILVTFTIGFLVIGAVLGFVGVAGCGSVFRPHDDCGDVLATQRAFVIAFIGLGLTTMAAAIVADQPMRDAPAGPAEPGRHRELTMSEGPTRLERVVDVLAKAVIALLAGGFVLLLVNHWFLHHDSLNRTALGAINSGLLVALIILLMILGSVIAKKIRGRGKRD